MQNRRTSKLLLLTTLLALPFFAIAGDANWTGGIALPGGTELKPVPPAPQPHENEIMIDATEAGVGGFHRVDNKIHPYGADNVWRGHIVPPQIKDNIFDAGNGFIGVRFESLEELFKTLAALAKKRQAKIAVLNINSHGIPGCLFVPKSSSGDMTDDMESYNTYYTPVGKSDIMQLRAMAQSTSQQHWSGASCEPEFRAVIAAIPDMKSYFTADAQIHIQACVVGLDARGKRFTETLAELLLDGDKAAVQTSVNFGLGDWSMPEGLGFWDYQNDEQMKKDSAIYPVNRKDRELMQKGTIRLAYRDKGRWTSALVGNQDFMYAGRAPLAPAGNIVQEKAQFELASVSADSPLPDRIRVPGTNKFIKRIK